MAATWSLQRWRQRFRPMRRLGGGEVTEFSESLAKTRHRELQRISGAHPRIADLEPKFSPNMKWNAFPFTVSYRKRLPGRSLIAWQFDLLRRLQRSETAPGGGDDVGGF